MTDTQQGVADTRERVVDRLRAGPNSAITVEPEWQWYELGWCVVVCLWFSTTGRVIELIIAASLICCWVFAPAITVLIGGNLALIGFQITPETLWALGVTELLFALPIVFEGWATMQTRTVSGISTVFLTLLLALAVIGGWLTWPPIHIVAGICLLYLAGVFWQQVSVSTQVRTNTHER
ncbi:MULTISPECIES: hypothetical protein [Halopenitus]|uniref:hypothetical protein n=1 Tax=Halopenitus TaxID=1209988 RepID=UPI00115F7BEC|nr:MULTISPECIES: hypothetical protein [Halopenitus]